MFKWLRDLREFWHRFAGLISLNPQCPKCGGRMKCVGIRNTDLQKIYWYNCRRKCCDGKVDVYGLADG